MGFQSRYFIWRQALQSGIGNCWHRELASQTNFLNFQQLCNHTHWVWLYMHVIEGMDVFLYSLELVCQLRCSQKHRSRWSYRTCGSINRGKGFFISTVSFRQHWILAISAPIANKPGNGFTNTRIIFASCKEKALKLISIIFSHSWGQFNQSSLSYKRCGHNCYLFFRTGNCSGFEQRVLGALICTSAQSTLNSPFFFLQMTNARDANQQNTLQRQQQSLQFRIYTSSVGYHTA